MSRPQSVHRDVECSTDPLCVCSSWNGAVVGPEHTPPAAFCVFGGIHGNIGAPTHREQRYVYPDRNAEISKGYRVRFDPTSETAC